MSKKTSKAKPKRLPGVALQPVVRRGWRTFRGIPKDDDANQWLAKLRGGSCVLGTFYCGVFVQDGYCYNETPEVIKLITHVQKVEAPNDRDQARRSLIQQ